MSNRKESEVWSFFAIIAETPHLAKCLLCKSNVSRGKPDAPKKSFSCKGLWDHLSSKHKGEFKTAKGKQEDFASKKQKQDEETTAEKRRLYELEEAQPSLQAFMEKNTKWAADSHSQLRGERLLLNWVFDDLQGFGVEANLHFGYFFKPVPD